MSAAPKVRRLRAQITPTTDGLQELAARLYPESAYLQAEWVRAVGGVRQSSRGWLLDKPVTKAGHA